MVREHPREQPLAYAPTGELYLGSQIRSLRQAKGWSLTALSRQLACHPGALSLLETNKAPVSARMLSAIATALGVAVEDLAQAPIHPALAGRRTTVSRQSQPDAPEDVAESAASRNGHPAPVPAGPSPMADEPPLLAVWTFGHQVEAIIASFQLAPREQQLARDLISDLTRTVCLRLTEGRMPVPTTGATP